MGSSSISVAWLGGVLRQSVPNCYNYSKRRLVRRSDCLQSTHSRALDSGSFGNCMVYKSEAELVLRAKNFDSGGADVTVVDDMMQSWN